MKATSLSVHLRSNGSRLRTANSPAPKPIEQNHCLGEDMETPLDQECYRKDLLGDLHTYLHARPDIAFAISVVSQLCMILNDLIVYRILRCLKSCLGKGLLYTRQGSLQVECYSDVD